MDYAVESVMCTKAMKKARIRYIMLRDLCLSEREVHEIANF